MAPLMLKMDLDAGHFSASDRYKLLRELAVGWAFLLDRLVPGAAASAAKTAAAEAAAADAAAFYAEVVADGGDSGSSLSAFAAAASSSLQAAKQDLR
jgi:hypothetical protein